MNEVVLTEKIEDRMQWAVRKAWWFFIRKAGNGLISINKEASMQLQYSYILQQLLPSIRLFEAEAFEVELESGVNANDSPREVDIILTGKDDESQYRIAIEMKCYRTFASSGKRRGATDIFKKDVYVDLMLLEQYQDEGIASKGVFLIMCDLENFIIPKSKDSKSWTYDISDGNTIQPGIFSTPVGGKNVDIILNKSYQIRWEQHGKDWFSMVEAE